MTDTDDDMIFDGGIADLNLRTARPDKDAQYHFSCGVCGSGGLSRIRAETHSVSFPRQCRDKQMRSWVRFILSYFVSRVCSRYIKFS